MSRDVPVARPPGTATLVLDRIAGIAALLWAAAVVWWIGSSPFPLLQDYPECVYQGSLISAIFRGDATVAGRFELARYPVPNSLAHLLLGVADLAVPAAVAGKGLVILYVMTFTALVAIAARRLDPAHSGKLLLVGLLTFVLGSPFWNGYANYQGSLLLFTLFVTLWNGRQSRSPWLVVAFSLLLFFAHAVTFGMFVLLVVLSDFEEPRRRAAAVLALLPSLALLAWYAVAHRNTLGWTVTDPAKDAGPGVVSFLEYKAYTVMKQGPFQLFQLPDGTSHLAGSTLLYRAGVAANGAFAALLIGGFCLEAVARRKTIAWRFPVAALAMFLVAPQVALSIVNPGERILLPGLAVLFLGLAPPRRVLAAMTLVALAALPLTASFLVDPQGLRDSRGGPGQRLFTHRPYQLEAKGRYVLDPSGRDLPPLGFDTSVLSERAVLKP